MVMCGISLLAKLKKKNFLFRFFPMADNKIQMLFWSDFCLTLLPLPLLSSLSKYIFSLIHPFAPFHSSILPHFLFSSTSFSLFPPLPVIHLSSPPSSTPATTHQSLSQITESICDIRLRQLCQEQLPWPARHIWSVSALGRATNAGCPAQKKSHKY